MPIRRLLACLPLVLCLFASFASAADNVADTRIDRLHDQIATQIDGVKDAQQRDQQILQLQVAGQDKEIAAQGARIGDLSLYLAIYGVLATLVGIGVAIVAYVTAGQKARAEAEAASERWFEKYADDLNKRISDLTAELNQHADKAHEAMERTSSDLRAAAQKHMKEMEAELAADDGMKKVPIASAAVEAVDQELRHKAEANYTHFDWRVRATAAFERGDFEMAASYFGEASNSKDASEVSVAVALYNKALSLKRSGKLEESLAVCDQLIARFGASDESALITQVVNARISKGLTLASLSRHADAIGEYDQLIDALGESKVPALQIEVARALLGKGDAIYALKRFEDAQRIYNQVVARFGNDDRPVLRQLTARALVNMASALVSGGKPKEAVELIDRVLTTYGEDDSPSMSPQLAGALVTKAVALKADSDMAARLTVYDEVIARFGDSPLPETRVQVAVAMVNKGIALKVSGRFDEAIATYDSMIERFKDERGNSKLDREIARAMDCRGYAFQSNDRLDEAMAAYDDAIAKLGGSRDAGVREQIARMFLNKGIVFAKTDCIDEAIGACDEAVRQFGDDRLPGTRLLVAKIIVQKAMVLRRNSRAEASLAVYDDVVARYGDDASIGEQVLIAITDKGRTLVGLNREEEALKEFDQAIDRFSSNPELAGNSNYARLLSVKADLLVKLKQPDAARVVRQDLITHFGSATDPQAKRYADKAKEKLPGS